MWKCNSDPHGDERAHRLFCSRQIQDSREQFAFPRIPTDVTPEHVPTMKLLAAIISSVLLLGVGLCHAEYHTNSITTPGGSYAFSVDGGEANNPTIELIAGVTNVLDIQTDSIHPVVVTATPNIFDWYPDATPQPVSAEPIAVTTPTSGFPTTLYYMCYFHGFYGEIQLSAPASPAPPPNTILEVRVGTNVVMTSTGTSTTWFVVPEFSSNLVGGAWSTVPNYINQFANGTNTTTFDRLDPICGANVFLRIRQQQN